jgi:type VI protein secretion system component Hcp
MRMSRKVMATVGSAAVVVGVAGAYVAADAMSATASVRPSATATCKPSKPNLGTLTAAGVISKETVTSLSNPISNAVNIGSSGTGSGAGKPTIGPVTITTGADPNTPKFLTSLATGRRLSTVTVTLGCDGVTEYTYTFTTAEVVGVTTSWQGGAQTATIQLAYGKVSETPKGGATFCWNAETNSSC